jgi:hypothetical protein
MDLNGMISLLFGPLFGLNTLEPPENHNRKHCFTPLNYFIDFLWKLGVNILSFQNPLSSKLLG